MELCGTETSAVVHRTSKTIVQIPIATMNKRWTNDTYDTQNTRARVPVTRTLLKVRAASWFLNTGIVVTAAVAPPNDHHIGLGYPRAFTSEHAAAHAPSAEYCCDAYYDVTTFDEQILLFAHLRRIRHGLLRNRQLLSYLDGRRHRRPRNVSSSLSSAALQSSNQPIRT